MELASNLLGAKVQVKPEIVSSGTYTVFSDDVLTRPAIYVKTPLLLNTLIKRSEKPLPQDFLLTTGGGTSSQTI